MARDESDREDLLREAVAYPRRAEFRIEGEETILFAGLRPSGTSLYVGADPVYHFDADHRLRRAFVDGDLYRSQGTTLARLRRHRTETTSELLRHDLDESERATFLERVAGEIRRVIDAIEAGRADVTGSVPEEDDGILEDLAASLRRHFELGQPLAPAIKGKN